MVTGARPVNEWLGLRLLPKTSKKMSSQDRRQHSAENISIHDNQLLAYSVNSKTHEICLHTVYWRNDQPEYVDIVFTDVFAYQFDGDTFETVLYDIEEANFSTHYHQDEEKFRRLKNYGWPQIEYESDTELFAQIPSYSKR